MLILEGSDHLGKTTAAQTLVKLAAERVDNPSVDDVAHPIRYTHMTRPNKAFDFLYDYQDLLSKYAVQDRFHLGALVWHKGVITPESLQLIESWIGCLGSYTVIFASTNDEWYRAHLEGVNQMFDIDTLIAANDRYLQMISGVYPYNVQYDEGCIVGPDFPTERYLNGILTAWYRRLELCST